MLAKLQAHYIQAFTNYKSSDGSLGVTALQAGIQFKNGLYVGGTFSAAGLPLTTDNITISGTAGNGYIQYAAQTVAPSLALVHTYADSGGHFAIGASGSTANDISFTNSLMTANRSYAFQDKTGTLAMAGDNVSEFTNDSGFVVGPGSAVSGRLPSFNGTTGKLIQDSGILASDVVSGPSSAVTGRIASFNGATGKLIQDSGILVSSVVLTSRTLTEGAGLAGNTYDLSANRTLAMGTPSTLSIASTNAASGITHTHLITSSSNPGAATALLSSDGSGYLQLVRLGIGVAPTQPLHVAGNAFIDATTANLYLKDTSTGFQASASGVVTLQSGNAMRNGPGFASGLSGWNESYNGDVEFNNGRFRGEFAASVFKVSEISASAGTLGVFYSAAALNADCTTGSAIYPTTGNIFNLDAKNSDAGGMLFAVNDVIRLKSWTGAAVSDSWGVIQSRTNHSTYTSYSVALVSGSTSATFRAGTAVVDYGVSGAGFITLSTDGTVGSSPNLTMATHVGAPYSATTTLLRLGNLNGSYGYVTDVYGLGIGQYGTASKSWQTIDQTNGFRIGNNTTVLGQWDVSGNAAFGQVATNEANVYWNSSNSRLEFRGSTSGTVVQSYIDTDGAWVSAGGTLRIDVNGIKLAATASVGTQQIVWQNGGTSIGGVYALYNAGVATAGMQSLLKPADTGGQSRATLQAVNDNGLVSVGLLLYQNGSTHVGDGGANNTYAWLAANGLAVGGSGAVPTHMLEVYGTGWFQGALSSDSTVVGTNIKATAIGARAYNSANISIGNAAITTITLDSERWDTDTIHSTSSNTSRLTCKTAGKYVITGTFEFAANSTGSRIAYIYLNGATIIARDVRTTVTTGSFQTGFTITAIYDLAVNDYVELKCYQDSGGSLNVANNANFSPEFTMVWMGP